MTMITDHPNPQFRRDNWQSLNGEWQCGYRKAVRGYRFATDSADLLALKADTPHSINVPFCIESELSGIGHTGFVNIVWYRRRVDIRKGSGRVMLNIGAADYRTTVFVNNTLVGTHTGGYTPIRLDITDAAHHGDNEIFIVCEDDTRSPHVPSGKQSDRRHSYACSYTRTTGIWQSVYIEYVPAEHIRSFRIYPDAHQGNVTIELHTTGTADIRCTARYGGRSMGSRRALSATGTTMVQIPLKEKHLWQPGDGQLYDLELSCGDDIVHSYFGLRSVGMDGYRFLLNGRSVFQRLVLDQGYYKQGIYTARDDDELVRDIRLAMDLGFNGARLHQKVFDPRYLYYCDMMGYMVWGEYANWGLDYSDPRAVDIFLAEWSEVLQRDCNHPSIIGWCPFNETWDYHGRRQYDPLLRTVYQYTKMLDPTRPCIDTSGNFHVVTDIYDVHDYRYEPDEFRRDYDRLVSEGYLYEHVLQDNPGRQHYDGGPVFISEYGGIKWTADKEYKSWGYGTDVTTEEELAQRYDGLTRAILNNKCIMGLCYTQLYDVEQEQNGLYTYAREPKFSPDTYDKIRRSTTAPAAIESE